MPNTRFVMITTTVSQPAQARALARRIVNTGLAACVQMWPIHSVYRWQGRIESAPETAMVCKTCTRLVPSLMEFIRQNHPYETPEIVVTPIRGGLPAYLEWVEKETSGRQPRLTFRSAPTNKLGSAKGRKA